MFASQLRKLAKQRFTEEGGKEKKTAETRGGERDGSCGKMRVDHDVLEVWREKNLHWFLGVLYAVTVSSYVHSNTAEVCIYIQPQ